jgi:8-oxo-dGTP pyrophosphatase MutT (NUDIX family)
MRTVLAAGGVVYLAQSKRILLVQHPDFEIRLPKGLQLAGESLEQTALREVAEETGTEARVLRQLGTAHWEYEYDGERWNKQVTYYLMVAESVGPVTNIDASEVVGRLLATYPLAMQLLTHDSERSVLASVLADEVD